MFLPYSKRGDKMPYNINAKFFKFAKKVNSTRRPSEQPATMLNRSVEIIEPFDLLNPTIKVVDCWTDEIKDTWTYFMQFNYIKLGDTEGNGREIDRYYWIRNWRREGGVNYAECEVDVLASWRGTIHGYEGHPNMQLVERCSAAVNNTLTDTLRPATGDIDSGRILGQLSSGYYGWGWDNDKLTYTVTMFPLKAQSSSISNLNSETNIWTCNGVNWSKFSQYLSSPILLREWDDTLGEYKVTGGTGKSIRDYVDNILVIPYRPQPGASCSLFEFGNEYAKVTIPQGTANLSTVPFAMMQKNDIGEWTFNLSSVFSGESWRDNSNYITLSLRFNPFGQMTIPVDYVRESKSLRVKLIGDILGNVTLIGYGGNSTNVPTWIMGSSKVGLNPAFANIPNTSSELVKAVTTRAKINTATNIVSSGLAAIGSTVSGNYIGTALSVGNVAMSMATQKYNIADAIKSEALPGSISTSGVGGTTMIDTSPVLTWVRQNVAPAQNDKYGRPLHEVRALSTLVADGNQPGFVQCSDANIDDVSEDYTTYGRNGSASMTITEKTAICNFLNGGVYLE